MVVRYTSGQLFTMLCKRPRKIIVFFCPFKGIFPLATSEVIIVILNRILKL